MDNLGNVTVFLTPQMAAVLAENLPVEELEEAGVDAENCRKRLQGAVGGEEAPRDLAGKERGFSVGGNNERTGVWGDSATATPSQYEHGYARGMV